VDLDDGWVIGPTGQQRKEAGGSRVGFGGLDNQSIERSGSHRRMKRTSKAFGYRLRTTIPVGRPARGPICSMRGLDPRRLSMAANAHLQAGRTVRAAGAGPAFQETAPITAAVTAVSVRPARYGAPRSVIVKLMQCEGGKE
jgi:hypothetical protein